jgi:putative oxidoreductase
MKINLTTIGRILFALPFGVLGISHFFMIDFYLGMINSFIPGMGFSIFLVGGFLIAASISIILNKMVKLSCWVLAFLLFLFIVTIHIPNLFNSDPHKSTIAIIELMKDTGLLGGALMIAGLKEE